MIKDLLQAQKDVEKFLKEDRSQTDWAKEIRWFNRQTHHLQHERLVHLLVTLTVGIAGLISCFYSLVNPIIPIFILDLIFMGLFIGYIFHYRFLENTTQKWYTLLKEMKEKL